MLRTSQWRRWSDVSRCLEAKLGWIRATIFSAYVIEAIGGAVRRAGTPFRSPFLERFDAAEATGSGLRARHRPLARWRSTERVNELLGRLIPPPARGRRAFQGAGASGGAPAEVGRNGSSPTPFCGRRIALTIRLR